MKRRSFLKKSAAFAGLGVLGAGFPTPGMAKIKGANGKLNIAQVGVAGMQGAFHLSGTESENRFALCDVDSALLDPVCAKYPDAKRFADWREMLDSVGDKIDAIVISTPDHAHAPVACAAMRRGIHCYCEKPLAHDVHEIRLMQKLAKEKKLVTQMGTQIHAGDNYRRVVELIRAGAIGPVTDVHAWVGTVWGGKPATSDDVAVPATLNWDLWIGSAPMRPFQPCYLGGNWRSFWDFGNGGMGDMACHFMDLPFWALDLKYPKTIEAIGLEPADADYAPADLSVRFTFDAPEGKEPLSLTWYDGARKPPILSALGLDKQGSGVIFLGKEGAIYSDYSSHWLLPTGKFDEKGIAVETIPTSIGHHAEWIKEIRDGASGGTTTCDFAYSGRLAETVLLGPVAYRCGKKLNYDADQMAATNCAEASKFFTHSYRDGWGLDF